VSRATVLTQQAGCRPSAWRHAFSVSFEFNVRRTTAEEKANKERKRARERACGRLLVELAWGDVLGVCFWLKSVLGHSGSLVGICLECLWEPDLIREQYVASAEVKHQLNACAALIAEHRERGLAGD